MTLDEADRLLERAENLDVLGASFDALGANAGGRLVFVGGEAGVGKTSCLQRFCDEHGRSARVLWGACDNLFTPRPLGPFVDVAQIVGGELRELAASGARPHEVAASLLRELKRRAPTILVVEDLHWADEATLDVMRLLGPRVDTVPALVLGSYRDDALEPGHPLRILLGELATSRAIGRLKIKPLSRAAVSELAASSGVDADELYRKTAGNPFFVTESLAVKEQKLPETVRDAVLARTARLSHTARTVMEAAAIVPEQVELWLLDALAADAIDHLDECLSSGMLVGTAPGFVAFRHELARLTVEESIAPNRRVALNRAALAALAAPPGGMLELARLAHYAETAGDADAVRRFAPPAAEEAAARGAHREAAAQFARALRFGQRLSTDEQAALLTRRSYECYLTGQLDAALEAQERALDCHRRSGDERAEGDSLRSLSRLLRYVGRVTEAMTVGREAVALLERLPPGRELAMAYANVSHLYVNAEDTAAGLTWGTQALELAERLDELEPFVYALTNLANVERLFEHSGGTDKFTRSLELAQRAGFEDHAGRAFVGLVWWAPRWRAYDVADRYLEAGLQYCTERGLEMWRLYLLAYRARAQLDRGDWNGAIDSASLVLRDPRTSPMPRIVALIVLGLIRARRGDPDYWPLLDEAWTLAENTGELQRIEPAAAARAEAAWLEGNTDVAAQSTEAAFELAVRRASPWVMGELAFWRWRAGLTDEIPAGATGPFTLHIAGDWARAAECWSEMGSPYEAALARGDADNDDSLRHSLDELRRMGAQPAAKIVARRLRARGARGLPREPRAATRQNPANLTARELDVLALVAQGLHNSEIAVRLFLSDKTVWTHVSAILRKLAVRTRGQAGAMAVRLGLAGDNQ